MNGRKGFTLLELLVALALLALIGVGLAGALQLGTKTYVRSQSLGTNALEIAARAQLRRLLVTATPPNLLTPFPKEFSGTQTSLSFVTLAPLGFARHAAGMRVDISNVERELTMLITLFDDAGTTMESLSYTLASQIDGLAFRYFTGNPETGEWRDDWVDTASLPQLVSITSDAGSSPYWPEFSVALIYAN